MLQIFNLQIHIILHTYLESSKQLKLTSQVLISLNGFPFHTFYTLYIINRVITMITNFRT